MQGFMFARAMFLLLGLPVVDLPVARRHVVLAGKERFVIQHPDPPIIFARRKLLSQDQFGLLEHVLQLGAQFLPGIDLADSAAEGSVRNLQDTGQLDSQETLFIEVVPRQNRGGGNGELGPSHRFREIDLVGAPQNGPGIIHHHQAFCVSQTGEPVGVVIHAGRFPDEKGVEFRDPIGIGLGDGLHEEADLARGLRKVLDGRGIRGRGGIGRVDQDGQIEEKSLLWHLGLMPLLEIALREIRDAIPLRLGKLTQAQGRYGDEGPALLAGGELGPQQRRWEEPVELGA